jgi:hypothetical protein
MAHKGTTGCSMQPAIVTQQLSRHQAAARARKREAAIATQAQFCPKCTGLLMRRRRPNEDKWRLSCSNFCGYEAAA